MICARLKAPLAATDGSKSAVCRQNSVIGAIMGMRMAAGMGRRGLSAMPGSVQVSLSG